MAAYNYVTGVLLYRIEVDLCKSFFFFLIGNNQNLREL